MTIIVSGIVDRLSYLAYRRDWRAAYAVASQDVRDVRRTMRQEVALRRQGGRESELARIDARMSSHQSDLHEASTTARNLMMCLGMAKARRDKLLAARDEAKAIAA
jgi:hypothetical protein